MISILEIQDSTKFFEDDIFNHKYNIIKIRPFMPPFLIRHCVKNRSKKGLILIRLR